MLLPHSGFDSSLFTELVLLPDGSGQKEGVEKEKDDPGQDGTQLNTAPIPGNHKKATISIPKASG